MINGHRAVDVDSHVMEPDDLWEKYMDRRYLAYAPKTLRLSPSQRRHFCRIEVAGNVLLGADVTRDFGIDPYVHDGQGGRISYWDAYQDYIQREFSAEAYLLYMERTGVDYIVLYPTVGLPITAVPNLDPKAAAAIKHAYNSWLYDFCNEGKGRLIGVGALDLRDPDLAAKEAERCVRDLGFKAVYIHPDTPYEGIPLDHPFYEPIWSTVEALGVPLGTHESILHDVGSVGSVGKKHVAHTQISYAPTGVSFIMGEMMAALMFTGWICHRHPDLQVIFNESSTGWAATWFQYWDEKWEESIERLGGQIPEGRPDHPPSFYFKRQCSITGALADPGNRFVLESGLEDNLMVATDFPHPETDDGWRMLEFNLKDERLALDDDQIKKALWDNPARVFGLA